MQFRHERFLARSIASELTLAIGQLLRKRRSDAHAGGLNRSRASALSRLIREGAMTTADLARAEAMKPQSMKAILAVLEEARCVERQPHPTDGRQILFVPTAQGLEERHLRVEAKHAWLVDALARLAPGEAEALALSGGEHIARRTGSAAIAAGVPMLSAFVRVERRKGEHTLIDMNQFAHRAFSVAAITQFLTTGGGAFAAIA